MRAASPDKGFLCKQNRLPLRLPSGQNTKGSSVKQGQPSSFPSGLLQNDCAKGDVKIFHTTVQGQTKPTQENKLNQSHLWPTIVAQGLVWFCFSVSVWLLWVRLLMRVYPLQLMCAPNFPQGVKKKCYPHPTAGSLPVYVRHSQHEVSNLMLLPRHWQVSQEEGKNKNKHVGRQEVVPLHQ